MTEKEIKSCETCKKKILNLMECGRCKYFPYMSNYFNPLIPKDVPIDLWVGK